MLFAPAREVSRELHAVMPPALSGRHGSAWDVQASASCKSKSGPSPTASGRFLAGASNLGFDSLPAGVRLEWQLTTGD